MSEYQEAQRVMTATEVMIRQTRDDVLMRNLIMSSVHEARQKRGRIDPEYADSDAVRLAEEACLILFARMRQNMDGLEALIQQRDAYQKMAEQNLRMAPWSPIVIRTDP